MVVQTPLNSLLFECDDEERPDDTEDPLLRELWDDERDDPDDRDDCELFLEEDFPELLDDPPLDEEELEDEDFEELEDEEEERLLLELEEDRLLDEDDTDERDEPDDREEDNPEETELAFDDTLEDLDDALEADDAPEDRLDALDELELLRTDEEEDLAELLAGQTFSESNWLKVQGVQATPSRYCVTTSNVLQDCVQASPGPAFGQVTHTDFRIQSRHVCPSGEHADDGVDCCD